VRARLFWKLGLTYVAVLVAVLIAYSLYQPSEHRLRLLGLAAILLVAGAVLAFFFSNSFSSRVGRLKNFAKRIAEGDFRPLDLDGPQDELTDLGDALNHTAARLDR
jgi:HAMP domain-containing protein